MLFHNLKGIQEVNLTITMIRIIDNGFRSSLMRNGISVNFVILDSFMTGASGRDWRGVYNIHEALDWFEYHADVTRQEAIT